jgi:tellurite resistance protein
MEHTALIYTMVIMSAADSDMTDVELGIIGEMVRTLPAFKDFDADLLPKIAEDCAELIGTEGGLDTVIKLVKQSLPLRLRETAYALACDVAAADGKVSEEEVRLLELMRDGLELDRLVAAALERGARAHFQDV